MLERFNIHEVKFVSMPLTVHFRLSTEQSPTSEKEMTRMKNVPDSSVVGKLMYAMICTKPDIAYTMDVVSRFITNPRKEYWLAVKWILQYLRRTSRKCLFFGTGKPML